MSSLGPDTWDAFAQFVERHNGVWGGCWCTWFHPACEKDRSVEGERALKQRLVDEGRAHAALVFDGDDAVSWCQYGTPEELPDIHHRKVTRPVSTGGRTTDFVDRRYRRREWRLLPYGVLWI